MIDVIVLSRDRPDLFATCLASIEAQGIDHQGWLVQNGTDEETPALARATGWKVICPGHNTSFSEGNNLAMERATGERIALVNNDAELHPGCLKALADHDEEIVGCLITAGNGLVNHAGGELRDVVPWHMGRRSQPEDWQCGSREWVTFATVMLSAAMVADVGPMDEGYWYSFEDVDYCLRARQKGYGVALCADARVTHDECSTRGHVADKANWSRFRAKWGDS